MDGNVDGSERENVAIPVVGFGLIMLVLRIEQFAAAYSSLNWQLIFFLFSNTIR